MRSPSGRRRSARSRSAASGPTNWCGRASRSNCAARTVRIDRFDMLAIRRDGAVRRRRRRGGLLVGHLHPRAGPRPGCGAGGGGHLTALRRTRVGGYGLDHARTLEELAEHPALSYTLDEACLLAFPRRDITDEQADDASHGRPLPAAGIDGRLRRNRSRRAG